MAPPKMSYYRYLKYVLQCYGIEGTHLHLCVIYAEGYLYICTYICFGLLFMREDVGKEAMQPPGCFSERLGNCNTDLKLLGSC